MLRGKIIEYKKFLRPCSWRGDRAGATTLSWFWPRGDGMELVGGILSCPGRGGGDRVRVRWGYPVLVLARGNRAGMEWVPCHGPGQRDGVLAGGGGIPCPGPGIPLAFPCGQTHTCENSTFPYPSNAGGKM